MNALELSKVGNRLVKRYKTRDPFEIAEALHIIVDIRDDLGSLKGMYQAMKRLRFIFLNRNLDEDMLKIVCAHEIGHDQLHRSLARDNPLREFRLYDMRSKPEYEANVVAAEIRLDSDEVLDYIYNYRYTAQEIANVMRTDINLVALKIAHLASLGYQFNVPDHRSDFLK